MTAALRPTDFQRLLGASALSNLSDGIRMVAFPLLAASITTNKLSISLVFAAGMAPWLVFGLFAGVMVDRMDRLLLLRMANTARAILLSGLALLILLDLTTVFLVGLAAFVLGAAEVLTDSTVSTITPSLVKPGDLDRANSRLVAAEILGNEFAGPAIGSVLFAAGAALPFLTNAGLLAASLLLLAGVGLMVPAVSSIEVAPGAWSGLGFIRGNPRLRAITLASSLLGAIDAAWFALLVLVVTETLGLSSVHFGVLLAIGAGGGLVGAWLGEKLQLSLRLIGFGVFASMALSLGAVAVRPGPGTVAAALVVTSAGFAVWNVKAVTARQRITPDGILGGVTATFRVLVVGSSIGGTVVGGLFASQAGLIPTIGAAGVLAALAMPVSLSLAD